MVPATRVLDNVPQAMDIGALLQGRKDKRFKGGGHKGSKGKGGKATSKSSGNGKGDSKKAKIQSFLVKNENATIVTRRVTSRQGEPISIILDTCSLLSAGMIQNK